MTQLSLKNITALALLAVAPLAQASWCEYYYDVQCSQPSNGNTNYDCANNGVFGSGGSYVKCHQTGNALGDGQAKANVIVQRCSDQSCSSLLSSKEITSNGACYPTGGAGPWYHESCAN